MTVLTFPSNPTNGQLYNAPNGIRYAYDGVKWIVETTTSTSEAVSNSTQDRVAPMFVDGDHNGISFTYNAATNALTATVTSSGLNTGTINLHNGGDQTAQILQFDNAAYQSVITGPTPASGNSAQRIIIQGQRATGQGEGGDVYVWGGDAQTDGGDIKIYAGDADSNTEGYGGYVNIQGGDGYTQGGDVDIQGGYSTNGTGGDVRIGAATSGNNLHGKVQISTNAGAWQFKPDGTISLPSLTTPDSNGNTLTTDTLALGQRTSNVVITQQPYNSDNRGSYNIEIRGQRGYGTWSTTGNGGWGSNIKIHGGLGGETGDNLATGEGGEGGYVEIRGGNGQAGKGGGYLELRGGDAIYSGGSPNTVAGGNVVITAGNATNGIETDKGQGGSVVISAGTGNKADQHGNVLITTENGTWYFAPDGRLGMPNGYSLPPLKSSNINAGSAPTVVYTSYDNYVGAIKATIRVSCTQAVVGGVTDEDTQICEILVARKARYANNVWTTTAVGSVYGVTHTSTLPLATFTVAFVEDYVSGPGAQPRDVIQILAEPTAAMTGTTMWVQVVATEITND